ncbi:MAG: hypothetical protein MHMPM18_004293 [Marteilia pararefringens]
MEKQHLKYLNITSRQQRTAGGDFGTDTKDHYYHEIYENSSSPHDIRSESENSSAECSDLDLLFKLYRNDTPLIDRIWRLNDEFRLPDRDVKEFISNWRNETRKSKSDVVIYRHKIIKTVDDYFNLNPKMSQISRARFCFILLVELKNCEFCEISKWKPRDTNRLLCELLRDRCNLKCEVLEGYKRSSRTQSHPIEDNWCEIFTKISDQYHHLHVAIPELISETGLEYRSSLHSQIIDYNFCTTMREVNFFKKGGTQRKSDRITQRQFFDSAFIHQAFFLFGLRFRIYSFDLRKRQSLCNSSPPRESEVPKAINYLQDTLINVTFPRSTAFLTYTGWKIRARYFVCGDFESDNRKNYGVLFTFTMPNSLNIFGEFPGSGKYRLELIAESLKSNEEETFSSSRLKSGYNSDEGENNETLVIFSTYYYVEVSEGPVTFQIRS